jgi:hypothetical protein
MTIALNRGARSVDSSVDHSESTSLDLEPLSPKECVHVMAEAASHLELWYNRFMIEDRAKRGVVDRGNFTQFRGKYALVRQGRALRTFFNIPDEQLRGLEDVNTYLGTLGPWLEPNVLTTLSTRSYHVPLPRFVAALARQITETTTSVFEVVSDSELVNNPDILKSLASVKKPGQFIVGFAAETISDIKELEASASAKLSSKSLDLIYVNNVSNGAVFGSEKTKGLIIDKDRNVIEVPEISKDTLSDILLDQLVSKLG